MSDAFQNEQFRRAAFASLSVTYPTIEEVETRVKALQEVFGVSDETASKCIRDIELQQGISMPIGAILSSPEFEPWLEANKSDIEPYYWDRYRQMLIQTGSLAPRVVGTLDHVTDEILGRCENPAKDGPWDRRGMVIGHVQSGKTGNYTGLICKAADAGYRLIVVIAGVHNKLRNQTQERIDEGFIGLDSSRLLSIDLAEKFVGVGKFNNQRTPAAYTNSLKDFTKATATSVGQRIKNNNEPMVFVIKKNSSTLKNLLEWLRHHNTIADGEKIDEPMILIDDEADNASINIAYGRGEVSKINGQIRDLLSLFERSSYVGYTATPFANIFVDPDTDHAMLGADLFPRNFIVSLDPPSNYIGPNRMFLEGPEDFLETIEDAEPFLPLSHKIDFSVADLPPSLVDAVNTFVVGRAIRLARGHTADHMSMLVNASRFTRVQDGIRNVIHSQISTLTSAVRIDGSKSKASALKNPEIRRLHDVWVNQFPDTDASWTDIQAHLLSAITAIKVVAINSRSPDTLDYKAHKTTGLSVIAVGGFALSRGLTLEGLMVSYFYRRSLMYDTLMQMGRWFGYREGYEDLCRVWMSEEAQGWFEHIAESVDLLREEVKIMQAAGASPENFGLKVRSHPDSLLITARNKIGFAAEVTVQIGLGNNMIETAKLLRSADDIAHNHKAANLLAERLGATTPLINQAVKTTYGWLVSGTPHEPVLEFIRNFRNHELSLLTQTDAVAEYVESRAATTLGTWDVLFTSLQKGTENNRPIFEFGLEIVPQTRAVGINSDSTTILVTEKQRVQTRGVEMTGVPTEAIAAAEVAFDEKNTRPSRDKPKTTSNYPDKIYRAVRPRPLLMIHTLRLTWENVNAQRDRPYLEPFTDPVIAWGISFPRPVGPEPRVSYFVNTQGVRESMHADGGEEDEEDLDAD